MCHPSRQVWYIVALALLLAACRTATPPGPPPPASTATAPVARGATELAGASPTATPPSTPTRTPTRTATPRPSATPAPTDTPTRTATPDAYAGLYIDDLRARAYGGGTIAVVKTLAVTEAFTRTLISYPSDGLTLYAFVDTPRGAGPFPVVIVCHGYVNPATYQTLAYTTRYADALARAGFLVFHPDYRGHGQSEAGPNPFRIGYAVDVLNLIALVKQWPDADPQAIGLFGHSMGGGISLRVLTVSPDVRGAVLYGAMSGDEKANFEKIAQWRGNPDLPELAVLDEVVARIAPINYLQDVQAAVSIHHGDNDGTVPPAWSADLDERLVGLGKDVEYWRYPGQPHTFTGSGETLLIERAVAFFERVLRP